MGYRHKAELLATMIYNSGSWDKATIAIKCMDFLDKEIILATLSKYTIGYGTFKQDNTDSGQPEKGV